MIKDSGKTQEFATGAHRDSQEGKGRMDLIPPMVILELSEFLLRSKTCNFNNISELYSNILKSLCAYYTTKNTEFLLNATLGSMQLIEYKINEKCHEGYSLPPTALLEVSKQYEEGANKYRS